MGVFAFLIWRRPLNHAGRGTGDNPSNKRDADLNGVSRVSKADGNKLGLWLFLCTVRSLLWISASEIRGYGNLNVNGGVIRYFIGGVREYGYGGI
ncbi:hypothetical protein Zmor_012989 [Zophobas morio]|uniref:Uncharacterized protein n=1 Tax=Zophobas morio TaxID=2755281 RepID=A0AA38MEW9_9CUCU|nr:hypothetical protein Zmor_012989 [Zophobas morio]